MEKVIKQPYSSFKTLSKLNQEKDYILRITYLNNLTSAYSTSNQIKPSIQFIQFHPHSSVLHSSSQLIIDQEKHPLGSVTQLKHSSHHSLLFAGFSAKPTLLGWDLRAHNFHENASIQLDGVCNSPFNCLDYCPETQVLVGGSTNEADSSETQIEVFDLRGTSREPLCIYNEAHSDSITNLKFQPGSDHRLLSASIDGLLILHDTRIQDQDESILSIGNVGASVATVSFSPDQKSIWCGTDMESLSLWDSDQLTLVKDFGDLRRDCWAYPNSNWTQPVSYLIDLINPSALSPTSRSAYFAGSQSGNVVLVDTTDIQEGNWNILGSLEGGHTEIVRCAAMDEQYGLILTGGEDGQICLWSTSNQDQNQKLSPQLEANHSSLLPKYSFNSDQHRSSLGSKSTRFHPY